MPSPLSTEARALIDRPNFAHLATLMADGSPHSVPVWVGDAIPAAMRKGRASSPIS